MASFVYNSAKKHMWNGGLDLDSDTIKVMLLDNTHTPSQDNHEFIDDVSGDEVSGTGYSAGGATLASKAVTQDNTDNEGVWDADDPAWTTASITARYAAYYKDTGTPATSPLIFIEDFGSDKTTSGTTFTINFNAEGILNLNDA